MKLIQDWRSAHKFLSVRFATAGALASAMGAAATSASAVAGAIWPYVPTLVACGLAFLTFIAVIVGRLIDQTPPAVSPTVPPPVAQTSPTA